MADEAKLTISLTWTNGTRKASAVAAGLNINITGTVVASGVVSVGTSAVQLDVGSVAAPRLVFLRNHDATNYVEFGDWNGAAPIYTGKLLAGEPAFFPTQLAATDIALKANTAACDVEYLVLDA